MLGIGAILSLIATALGLWNYWSSRTAEFSGNLSTTASAQKFVAFAVDHSGKTVILDLSCNDHPTMHSSCAIKQGVGQVEVVLWAFEGRRCFDNRNGLSACRGGNAFWIIRNDITGSVIANGPTGAGSLVIKGKFIVQDEGFGGGMFPSNIRNFKLTPVSA